MEIIYFIEFQRIWCVPVEKPVAQFWVIATSPQITLRNCLDFVFEIFYSRFFAQIRQIFCE
jgi:hypothetical protein